MEEEIIEEEVIDEEEQEEEMTPEQLKEQLAKEKEEKEKWKSRFKKTAAKLNNKGDEEEEMDAIVERKIQEKEIQWKVAHIVTQVPEKYREAFEAEFKELTEWKTLTSDNVDKYIKSAMAVSIPDDSEEMDAVKAIAIGWGWTWPKGTVEKRVSKDVEYSNKLLKEQWII